MNKISIVICCYNKWNFTKSALNDLSKLLNAELIIIDNASTDETQLELAKFSNIIYHKNDALLFDLNLSSFIFITGFTMRHA